MAKNVKLVEMQFDSFEDLINFLEQHGKEEVEPDCECEDTDEFEVYDDDYSMEDALELADMRIEELEEENEALGNAIEMLSQYVKTLQKMVNGLESYVHQAVSEEFETLRKTMNKEFYEQLDDDDNERIIEILEKYSDCE